MIFLDNSSSSFYKPRAVKSVINNIIEYLPFNPSRASHSASIKAGRVLLHARKNFAKHFNCSPDRVIFTGGCTEALNLAIFGVAKEYGHIITSFSEHNSVLRPLNRLKSLGINSLSFVSSPEEALGVVTEQTYMMVINHVSNVTGKEADLRKYGEICKDKGIIFIVDAAQSAGYRKIDIEKMGIDCLAIAGHKGLHGIMGAGALLLSEKTKLRPLKYGGTGSNAANFEQPTDIPEGLEAGTPPLVAIAAMSAGLSWSMNNMNEKTHRLHKMSNYLIENLKKLGEKVEIYSKENDFGIVSFNIKNMPSAVVSQILDEQYDIATRSGYHCAPLLHKQYGTINGMVRASIGIDTEVFALDTLINAIKEMSEIE